MKNSVIGSVVVVAALMGTTAQAQSSRVDVTLYPSGHLIATDGKTDGQPGFRNNAPTAGVAVNLSSYIAVEGEFTGAFGVTQDLSSIGSRKSPSMLGYSGNLIANLAPSHKVQPYLAVGVGGMRMLARESLGVSHVENIETANAGGGLKVMFGQWGLRADYRFVGFSTVDDNASSFIGSDVRHAHRISAGFIIAPGRGIPAGNETRR
jgi:outer membrane protein with beta-barrel domain